MWYQQQLDDKDIAVKLGCDLLKNIYLCGINNNDEAMTYYQAKVVICLKISTFVVSTTTQLQQEFYLLCCDLLENIYLCGINNNW